MHKRLFIALPLPQTALKALAKYRDTMGRETPYLRWTPVANLHVTALFLGNVAEESIPFAAEALQNVCRAAKPFPLVCESARYAPPQSVPNMVWLSCRKSRLFLALVKRLAAALSAFAPEMDWSPRKADTPHVTLARFQKSVLPERLRRLRRTGLESTSVAVSSCALMESELTPSGPFYRTLSSYSFMLE